MAEWSAACPASQPIQTGGKCYARAAFGGHCLVDEQCYNVVGSQCRAEAPGGELKCQCPEGNFKNHFGRCIRGLSIITVRVVYEALGLWSVASGRDLWQ